MALVAHRPSGRGAPVAWPARATGPGLALAPLAHGAPDLEVDTEDREKADQQRSDGRGAGDELREERHHDRHGTDPHEQDEGVLLATERVPSGPLRRQMM